MAKIYTKTGDKGSTSLLGGQRVPKNHVRIQAYGTIDELNVFVGQARVTMDGHAQLASLSKNFEQIQHWLFDLGGLLASEKVDQEKWQLQQIKTEQIESLEKWIDEAASKMPPLKEFILPAGSTACVHIHLCRVVARRAEREMLGIEGDLPENAIVFINRISDYFFMMARFANHMLGVQDVTWKKS